MHHVNRLRRRPPEIVIVLVLRVMLFRRWMPEVAIVLTILVLLLVELSLRLMPGSRTVAHVVVWGFLFDLIGLWVYVNRAAFATWEQQDTEERNRVC